MTEYKKLESKVESLIDKVEAQAERIETLEEELYELKTGFEEAERVVEEAEQEIVNEILNEDEKAYLEQIRKFADYMREVEVNTEGEVL